MQFFNWNLALRAIAQMVCCVLEGLTCAGITGCRGETDQVLRHITNVVCDRPGVTSGVTGCRGQTDQVLHHIRNVVCLGAVLCPAEAPGAGGINRYTIGMHSMRVLCSH